MMYAMDAPTSLESSTPISSTTSSTSSLTLVESASFVSLILLLIDNSYVLFREGFQRNSYPLRKKFIPSLTIGEVGFEKVKVYCVVGLRDPWKGESPILYH